MRIQLVALSLLFSSAVLAADATPDAPPPPPMPDTVVDQGGNTPEPEVTIRKRGSDTVEEYRVNGQLYMVKITPKRGVPYYLIDQDGDGSLETYRSNLADPVVPQWILLRW